MSRKRIIICSDGTWSSPDQKDDEQPCPTNVVRMAHAIDARGVDDVRQLTF